MLLKNKRGHYFDTQNVDFGLVGRSRPAKQSVLICPHSKRQTQVSLMCDRCLMSEKQLLKKTVETF